MSAGRPRRGRVSGRTAAVLGAAYWSYFVNGMANSIIGPVLLSMVHTFHIGLAAAGAIVTAQFIGYLPGALGSGMAAERWGYRRVLVPSTLLMAAGSASRSNIARTRRITSGNTSSRESLTRSTSWERASSKLASNQPA